MDDQNEINEEEWRRLSNWSSIGTYSSARDTRIWVPKRAGGEGWTPNFGQPAGRWSMLGLFSVPIGLLLLFVLYQIFK
jgi:uncharacterized membrane protein